MRTRLPKHSPPEAREWFEEAVPKYVAPKIGFSRIVPNLGSDTTSTGRTLRDHAQLLARLAAVGIDRLALVVRHPIELVGRHRGDPRRRVLGRRAPVARAPGRHRTREERVQQNRERARTVPAPPGQCHNAPVPRAVVAAYLACALIWGTTWYAIRVSIAAYPTHAAVALRFAIAAVILLPIAARVRPWPRGRVWGWLVAAGVVDALCYLLVYLGEERVSGAVAAVLYGTQPLILAVLLTLTRIERLTRRHIIGAVLSLVGVVVLFLDRLDISAHQAAGVGLVVASVVASTVYSMIMKQKARGVNGLVSTTIFLAVTAVVLGAVALGAGHPLPWPPPAAPTLALLYLGIVGSVVVFLLYFWLLGKTSLQVTSTIVFVFPLIAIVTDALFERELPLTPRAYLGAAITLGGLAVSLLRR
jgi:drug/metabolite transporter (DMT)-like permease